jgi:hypothetical protein
MRLTPEEREQIRANITLSAQAMNPLTCKALLSLLDERDELERRLAQSFAIEHEYRELKDALKAAGLVARYIGTVLVVFGGSDQ